MAENQANFKGPSSSLPCWKFNFLHLDNLVFGPDMSI